MPGPAAGRQAGHRQLQRYRIRGVERHGAVQRDAGRRTAVLHRGPVHRRGAALLEVPVPDQLGVDAAVAGVVDLLQEGAELGGVERGPGLGGVHGDGPGARQGLDLAGRQDPGVGTHVVDRAADPVGRGAVVETAADRERPARRPRRTEGGHGLLKLAVHVQRDRFRRGVVHPGEQVPDAGLGDDAAGRDRGVGGRCVIGQPGQRELVGVAAQLQVERGDLAAVLAHDGLEAVGVGKVDPGGDREAVAGVHHRAGGGRVLLRGDRERVGPHQPGRPAGATLEGQRVARAGTVRGGGPGALIELPVPDEAGRLMDAGALAHVGRRERQAWARRRCALAAARPHVRA